MATPLLLSQGELDSPQTQRFATGEAVYFTQRAPNKTTINEDCMALIPYNTQSGVLLVADGMGGQPQGHTASKTAMDSIAQTVHHASQQKLPLREAILNGIELANQKILSYGRGAGTTLAIVEIQQGEIRPYHVGDSLILLLGQRGRKKLQSIAHSPVGYAVEAGVLDVDDAMHHAERHLVSNVLGSSDMHIQIGISLPLAKHDTLLLASDGLADNLYEEEITEIIRKGPLINAAQRLQQLASQRMALPTANLPCHPDDLSFILYRQTGK